MSPRDITHALLRRGRIRPSPEPRPEWHKVAAGPLAGAELYLAPEAVDTWRAMVAGTHDRHLLDVVAPYRSGDGLVCWDVGAHFGYHTLCFAALVGCGGRVVAFEPNPANLARMAMNLARNPGLASRVTVKPIALSDAAGRAEFRSLDHVESGLSTGGHLASATPPNEPSSYGLFRRTLVQTATVDELVRSGELPAPEWIKVDVEGAEAAVLRGGRGVIRTHRPLLLIEVHHILQMLELSQLLTDWGYRLQPLDREHANSGRCFILAEPGAQPK
jgi:FkbM family methyltransferase